MLSSDRLSLKIIVCSKMFAPVKKIFTRLIKKGNLRVTDASGIAYEVGDGTGSLSAVRFSDRWTEYRIALNPALAIGEAYMDGRLIIEEGDLYLFLDILSVNIDYAHMPRWVLLLDQLRFLARRINQFNPRSRARKNVATHYDIEPEIYKLFLDGDMQYSCAYFETEDTDLETAQLAKKRHLAAKLLIEPGQKTLDIGSGWGGMALYLAETADANVTGITLSEEQLATATARAKTGAKNDQVKFRLEDYRDTDETYDRIVSVGMLEHVGVDHYRTYFEKISRLLDEDGVAVIHSIGRFDGPYATNPFIRKYIFPGGSLPALSEIMPVIESLDLKICDIEILRLHYALTLRRWRERFSKRWDEAVALKGERFCRMWEVYLAGSEITFRYQDGMVFQLQLTHRRAAVPLTRDYIGEEEKRLSRQENLIAAE